ncbi:MAG: hypothetical protein JAY90_21940 [Candidatus Thiodiazotropha lotti]|nr:hypothetical protein [Candidatus Thiodiazotropha lotti]
MHRAVLKALLLTGISLAANSASHNAESRFASMEKSDMTYRQLMEMLGEASAMAHLGILRENKQMVKQATSIITGHPAPSQKPWVIMPTNDQAQFKATLLVFDPLLDQHASAIAAYADKNNWPAASQALSELNAACIGCHALWRKRVQ